MEIVEKNERYELKEPVFPIEVVCEHCDSILKVEEVDLTCGALGLMYFRCPVCKRKSCIYELDEIELTKDNIIFPQHFWHHTNGVDISPGDIKKWINDAIDFFRENPDAFVYVTGSGNTSVLVQNYSGDEEYVVSVTKDCYETHIPYEKEDYVAQDENGWKWKNDGVNLKRQKVKDETKF